MYDVKTYLARRPRETVKVYRRGLQKFSDHVGVSLDTLHEYITRPKEQILPDILTFADTLSDMNQNTQRLYVSTVMSYLSYNEILIPKAQRLQAVPKPGDVFRDKAVTIDQLRKIYEYLPPIGKAALLLLFCTGMRTGEVIAFKESDIEGRIIHLSGKYCKGGRGRDVVMTTECQVFLNDIWLPKKAKYLDIASRKTPKGTDKNGNPLKSTNGKPATDPRVIPVNKATLYAILMLGFKKAGLDAQSEGKNLIHPHSLRKSFKTIVGSVHPELSEILMGHIGYLGKSYQRYDLLQEYARVEPFLTMGSTEATISKVATLEKQNKELQERLQQLERQQQVIGTLERISLSEEDRDAIAKRLFTLQNQQGN
jgi:integrase